MSTPATVGVPEGHDGATSDRPVVEPSPAKRCKIVHAVGEQFMLHRQWNEDSQSWDVCGGTDFGRVADSIVHRYARKVGFERHNQAQIDMDPVASAAYAEIDASDDAKGQSHPKRVERVSIFERYVQARHPDHEYVRYLRELLRKSSSDADGLPEAKLAFVSPPEELVVSFVWNLRKDKVAPINEGTKPDHKYEGIKAYTGAITGMCQEFGSSVFPCHCEQIGALMHQWEDADETNAAVPFDFVADLPKLWGAVWAMKGWNPAKRLKVLLPAPRERMYVTAAIDPCGAMPMRDADGISLPCAAPSLSARWPEGVCSIKCIAF